jgi:hypothetical protein
MPTKIAKIPRRVFPLLLLCFFVFLMALPPCVGAQNLTLPAKTWGICFGNAPRFNGLRFNIMDNRIETINGINITAWKANDRNAGGTVNGLSLGLLPYAGDLNGIQVGLLGSGATKNMRGINIGMIGAGAGSDLIGLNFGGIGVGAGKNMKGVTIGLIGAGAGDDAIGINIGGLGIGAGKNLIGLNFGGLGVGAGDKVMGVTIAGIGAGAGDRLTGLTVCGLAAGAPTIKGLTVAGLALGGKNITGISIALGSIQVRADKGDGEYNGLAVSAFNFIKGTMKGVAVGIVNYAYRLKGLQIGLVNIVRDNPRGRTVLPIINFNF